MTALPALPGQYTAVAALSALSTAGCLVDAGPVPGGSFAPCDCDGGCAASGTVHVCYADETADVAPFREGDWCPAHARAVVLAARERTSYVDVEVRQAVTAGAEAAA